MQLNGSLTLANNSVSNQSYSGILIRNSTFSVIGNVEFLYNKGDIGVMYSTRATTTIIGSLIISGNSQAMRGIYITESSLNIIGPGYLNVSYNALSFGILNVYFQSNITVTGRTICTGNSLSNPFIAFFSKITLNGHAVFTNNTGILYAYGESNVNISGTSKFIDNSLVDGFSDGTLSLERSTLVLSGDYLFERNQVQSAGENGGAIFASIRGTVNLSGNGAFINNSARYGGALYLDQRTGINIMPGTKLLFQQNRAVKGAAIFIQTSLKHVTCSSKVDSCLFRLPDDNAANDISLVFTGNQGKPGGSVIHANVEDVDFTIENQTFTALEDLETIALLNQNNSEPKYYSESYLFCFCINGSTQKCEKERRKDLTVTRGKKFNITVRALRFYGDHNDEPVQSNLESLLESDSENFVSLSSQLVGSFQVVHNEKCAELIFRVNSVSDQETVVLNIGESILNEDKTLYLDIAFDESCPLGFALVGNKCDCDTRIAEHFEECDLDEETFRRKNESLIFWMGSFASNNTSASLLFYEGCPRGYCIGNGIFSLSDDELSICDNNRTGNLCGECNEGCSLLLGGVKCDDCSEKNAHLALLIVFAALGIVLVALIFLIQTTVAMGTINGLILYINIVDVNQNSFLTSNFFKGYTIFISWLNLDFGFETCFYNGMDQRQYAAWQFVFPVYLWLLVGGIVVVCRYSLKVSTFFGSSNPVAVLATIILLTYNSLVQNIITIFSPAHLVTSDNSTLVVWRYDGNIVYATGYHIALIVLALMFFVFLFAPFTLVLTFSQLLQKFDCTSKILQRLRLVPFIEAYQIPFKPTHRYWVGLCLMMRATLLVIFALDESKDTSFLSIITFCVVSLSMLGITGGVYRTHWINILEISFILNLGVLSTVRLYLQASNEIVAYISVTVALVTFLGIVVFHIYLRLKKQRKVKQAIDMTKKAITSLKKKLKMKLKSRQEIGDSSFIEVQAVSPDTQYQTELREPLLESRS